VKAKAQRIHDLPGRTRFKIPERRGDQAFFNDVCERLRKYPSVREVEANPVTGSLLLQYAGELESEPVQAALNALAELVELELSAPPVAKRLRADAIEVDQTIRRFTHGALDLGSAAALGLLALAGVQLLRGQQPVSAISLAWYATELLRRWEEPVSRGHSRPPQTPE
jgi:Heavy metal associated domain 2